MIVAIMPFSKKHSHLVELMAGVLIKKVKVKFIEFKYEDISASIKNGWHIITVGRPPERMDVSTRELLRSSTHFIWDKYPLNSGFVCPKSAAKFATCVVKRLYSCYQPRLIVVNNPIMKRDFARGLCAAGLDIGLVCTPHPVTREAIGRAKEFESNENTCCHKKWILYDSPIQVSFKDGLDIGCCSWADARASSENTPPSAIFNYRREVGYYLVTYSEKLKIAKKFLLDTIRYIKLMRSDHGWLTALKELIPRSVAKPLTINQRWKPGTKFSVSIAYGIPLVTPPEASIRYMCGITGYRVYEYHDTTSFDLAKSGAFTEDRKDVNGQPVDYLAVAELINHSFIEAALP